MKPFLVQLQHSTRHEVMKRLHFPLSVMLVCARRYAAYSLSTRNLEEMRAEPDVRVDHGAAEILSDRDHARRQERLPGCQKGLVPDADRIHRLATR